MTFIFCLWERGGVSDVLTLCHACCDTEKVPCALLVWSKEHFLLHFTLNWWEHNERIAVVTSGGSNPQSKLSKSRHKKAEAF